MQAAEARRHSQGKVLRETPWGPQTGISQSSVSTNGYTRSTILPIITHRDALEDPVSYSKWDASGVTGLPWWLSGKESTCSAGDMDSIPGLGRSSGESNDNPLQHSCLGNHMDRGAWWATVHAITKELDMTWWLTRTLVFYLDQGISDNAWLGPPPDWLLLNLTCQGG